jgi:hypothetical protein
MNLFVGPVSKNVTDVVIDYVNRYNCKIVFIPSRRQIEYTGGYVNNWTTQAFCQYVRSRSTSSILIERDHSGPEQGRIQDDGFASLKEDCKYLDIIHIDPWKAYTTYKEGLEWTLRMIEYCYNQNPRLLFEIGTEEAIRPFSTEELDNFLMDVKQKLPVDIVSRIKYVVIQCGTQLQATKNVGHFSPEKLQAMLKVVQKHGFEAKEHNGDWVAPSIFKEKMSYGLTHFNIAPELGEIETRVLLSTFSKEDVEEFYKICYESNTWVKWVSDSFDAQQEKELLMRVCGHYLFSDPRFLAIKQKYPTIDSNIQRALRNKLHLLYGIYTERTECIICKGTEFSTYFEKDYDTPMTYCFDTQFKYSYFIPYNIYSCTTCKTVQTKYLGDLRLIYEKNHQDGFGSLKSTMYDLFSKFITDSSGIDGLIEAGACTDILAECILKHKDTSYTVVEPDFKSTNSKLKVYSKFLDDTPLNELSGNTLVMSHLFEHLYDPVGILEKIRNSQIQYIFLNHPNLENDCKSHTYIILNIEHIYYVENAFLIQLLDAYGFTLVKRQDYGTHSIFLQFERKKNHNELLNLPVNITAIEDTHSYFDSMLSKIDKLNRLFMNTERKYYLWPAATYIVTLFVNGLDTSRIAGLLDNSPNKIGKKLYGYNLECFDFKKILASDDPSITIILGGSSGYRNELTLAHTKVEVLFLDDI